MYKLPLRLAFKYFKSNKGGIFSFTSFLAVTGLTIGVSSLIIVMSVMNGFEKELQDRILGVVPHAVIYSDEPIANYEELISELKLSEGIEEAVPYISFQALITSNSVTSCFRTSCARFMLRAWMKFSKHHGAAHLAAIQA